MLIKNTKIDNNQNKNMIIQNKEIENINENLNIENIKNEFNKNNNKFNINNEIKNLIKLKKIKSKPNSKAKNIFYEKNNGSTIYNQSLANIALPKKKMDISLNDNKNFSINNSKNMNTVLRNKYSTMINKENKKNVAFSKIILSEEDNKKNVVQQKNITNKKVIINAVNSGDNKSKGNFNNKNKSFKKMAIQKFKIKNYYGYDERHNLEGPINNHSYFVSVYSRKKVNENNNSIESMN